VDQHNATGQVDAREVGIRFPSGTLALHGLNMQVASGEFVSLVGPSGCGKSTFLRLVAGLLEPTEGRLTVGGMDPDETGRPTLGCGFVFKSSTVLPWRTVVDNVALPMELEGVGVAERRARAMEWLERVGLTGFAEAWPASLSEGMRIRVSMARALVGGPTILLMDDPFSATDDITRAGLQEELLRLRGEFGFAVLFSTQSVPEAVFLSDRVAVLSELPGRILGEVAVDLGKRRDPDLRGEATFASKVREVVHLLARAQP